MRSHGLHSWSVCSRAATDQYNSRYELQSAGSVHSRSHESAPLQAARMRRSMFLTQTSQRAHKSCWIRIFVLVSPAFNLSWSGCQSRFFSTLGTRFCRCALCSQFSTFRLIFSNNYRNRLETTWTQLLKRKRVFKVTLVILIKVVCWSLPKSLYCLLRDRKYNTKVVLLTFCKMTRCGMQKQ